MITVADTSVTLDNFDWMSRTYRFTGHLTTVYLFSQVSIYRPCKYREINSQIHFYSTFCYFILILLFTVAENTNKKMVICDDICFVVMVEVFVKQLTITS